MKNKINSTELCFDTLPFLRDVLVFATDSKDLTKPETLEKARNNQEKTQEIVDCLSISRGFLSTKIIELRDEFSEHVVAVNCKNQIIDPVFGLDSFLGVGGKIVLGDSVFDYDGFSFNLYNQNQDLPYKTYSNPSSALLNLKEYELTSRNFLTSNYIGSMWRREAGKMKGFINFGNSELKVAFGAKKFKFEIAKIRKYEIFDSVVDEYFSEVLGEIYSRNSLVQIKENILSICENFENINKIKPNFYEPNK